MAKNNNVKDFAKDIADAIRAKTGTTAKINPQNFSTVILSIESGTNDKPDVGKAMLVTYAKNNFETPLKNVLTTIKSGSTSLASGYTDSQGRFAQQVDSGTYTITTGAKDYHKVPESRQVTADVDKATYVYMDYDATSLTVTAKKDDGTLIPNVALTAVMNYGGNVYNIGGSTKENGVGVIIVPPATGTLKVKTNIDGYYTPASPSVTTTLGQNTDVELIYNRIVTAIDLSVVDYKGSPVTGATVVVTGPNTYSGETDDSGKFYREVLAGTYTISVTAPSGLLSPEDTAIVVQQDTVQSVTVVCQKDMSAIDPVFGNNSLETIVSVANEISLANMTSTQVESTYGWHIGDTVNIPLTTGENIEMRIIGFNHDDLSYEKYKAGITLEMVGCLSKTSSIYSQTYNKYGWGDATLKTKMSDYKATLPQVLQDAVQPVDKKYAHGGGTSNLGVGVTVDELFILADVELRGSAATSQSALEEGVQYEYWASNYLAESSLIKFKDGTASAWWIRSLPASSARYFYQISGSGKLSTIDSYKSGGVSFAFCIGNGALVGYAAPDTYKPFNEYTASELKTELAYITSKNMSGGDIKRQYGWSVGDTTTMTLSTGESIDVRIIGIGHDVKSDGSGKAPLTLEMVKILPTGTKMMSVDSNEGGYVSSIVRNTYMPNLKQKLPKEWQDMIVAVDKKSANGGAEYYTDVITTSEELFIISCVELTGNVFTLEHNQEGRVYEYWLKNKTSTARKKDPVTPLPGGAAPSYWWLRSCGNSNNTFYVVDNSGGIRTESANQYSRGVSFAFCIGSAADYVPSTPDTPEEPDTPTFSRTFSENTPEQISAISAEISANNMTSAQVAETYGWNIGDATTIPLTTGKNIEMRITGFNHDDKSDGTGKAGITLEMTHCLPKLYSMNSSATNSGGYGSSVMRNTTLPEIKTTLPQEWQDVIKSVKKYASTGPNSYDGITSLNLDLFLLSEIELYGKKNLANNYDNEGSVYEYWKGRVDSDRAKTYGSSNSKTHWWLRSCQQNNNGCFCSAWDTGIPTADPANQTFGVSFAFCV